MIKINSILMALLFSTLAYSQYFPEGYNAAFKQMLKEGIHYVKTGDVVVDKQFETGLKTYWKVSPYAIIEENEMTDSMVLIGNYSITVGGDITAVNGDYHGLGIFSPKAIETPDDKYVIGRINYNGFIGRETDINQRLNFIQLMIQTLNHGAKMIQDKEIFVKQKANVYRGVSFYKTLAKANKNVTGLRLIIPEQIEKSAFFKVEKMTKLGLNCKVVKEGELLELMAQKNPNDCLVNWGSFGNWGTSLSIIKMATGEVVLSERRSKIATPYFDSPHKLYKRARKLFSGASASK